MSLESRISFPTEPLRTVAKAPTPATGSDDSIPYDYARLNQAHWRKAERGIFSRPLTLNHVGDFLHNNIVRVFELNSIQHFQGQNGIEPIRWPEEDLSDGRGWSYPSENDAGVEKLVATWSIPFDNPKSPSSQLVYSENPPISIKEEDMHVWSIGIGRITEYATNYATKEFLKRKFNGPIAKQVATLYGGVYDLMTYGILLNGTYHQMRDIEVMANHHKKDYTGAITKALFQHDFAPLNELIAMTNVDGYSGCNDINDLAIKIGRKRFTKPDIGKWIDKLDTRRGDKTRASSLRNGAISIVGAGVFRNPGVIEVSSATLPFLAAVDIAINEIQAEANNMGFINHPHYTNVFEMARYLIPDYFIPLATEALQLPASVLILMLPFVLTHEAIHHYSSNPNFMGLIPARLIKKEVTPYKSRLEPAEQPRGVV